MRILSNSPVGFRSYVGMLFSIGYIRNSANPVTDKEVPLFRRYSSGCFCGLGALQYLPAPEHRRARF